MTAIRNFYDAMLDPVCNRLMVEIPGDYKYHSLRHTLDVIEEAVRIGQSEGLNEYDLTLLKIAALFHDTGYMLTRKEHEQVGCGIFRDAVQGYGLSEEDVKIVEGCIMATRIPQSPKSHIEMILCDADLDYLGRDDFAPIAELLFEELLSCGEIESRKQWNEIQVRFLSKQNFHTEYAKKNRTLQLEQNLDFVKKLAEV